MPTRLTELPTARANGHDLYYEIHGAGEPLLCVMGLGSDSSGWALELPSWSSRYRTVVFDNRDCGRSSYAADDYTVREMAADTIALADALGLDRFHLLGLSLGGAIAQEVALACPKRVATLMLCVSYAGVGRWGRERVRLEEQALAGKSDQQLIEELMLITMSERTYEEPGHVQYMKNLILSYPHRQRREGYLRQLRASVTHDARDRLSALQTPTHVIGAERDLLVPIWNSHELADLIPGASLSVIEGAPHSVNVECPSELTALVLEFLR
jgi:3-oxoadipate enol-lactonase